MGAHVGYDCTPQKAFCVLSYATRLTDVFVDASFPILVCNRCYNRQVLSFLNVEAKQGKNRDGSCSPSHS